MLLLICFGITFAFDVTFLSILWLIRYFSLSDRVKWNLAGIGMNLYHLQSTLHINVPVIVKNCALEFGGLSRAQLPNSVLRTTHVTQQRGKVPAGTYK